MPANEPPKPKPKAVEATFAPGDMVDHFRIMRRLGRGGMGEVYLARDTTLGRRLALKVLHPKRFDSEHARARFQFEARTTAKFNHPHIVTVYAVGECEGRPYLALEYVEGDTLKARLTDRRLSLQESLRVSRAIAVALVEAHRHGVLHRDLKPGNVLIGRDGRVRVLDFGLAKVLEGEPKETLSTASPMGMDRRVESTITTMAKRTWGVGTPQYMAPEQWRNAQCGPATDVWALGVLLFRMLSGKLPYHESTIVEQALTVCDEALAPRVEEHADVPKEVANLIAYCLAKEPESRPEASVVVDVLTAQLDAAAGAVTQQQDPFRGLLPFTSDQAHLFFGREAEIASFVERARHQAVLPVVGPTAAGKSSFVRAGVIPRLLEQGPWTIIYLRPGGRPFHALAMRLIGGDSEGSFPETPQGFSIRSAQRLPAAGQPAEESVPSSVSGFRRAYVPGPGQHRSDLAEDELPTRVKASPGEISTGPVSMGGSSSVPYGEEDVVTTRLQPFADRLKQFPRRLSLELRALAEERGTRVLLFVDQLEELFTLSEDTALQRAFMLALCTATDDPADPVRVVFTLRDDFLGRVVTGPEVRDALSHVTVVQRPDAAALRDILTRPVEVVQYGFEDSALVEHMVAAVADEPACLPLLQFAARVLWDRRDVQRRLLLRSVYDHIGGVEGALAQHADGVLQGFSPDELNLARLLFLRLVTAERTRALVPRVQALEGLGGEAKHVLGRLTQSRLVSVSKQHGAPGGEAVLELAHESLIRSWATLARWIDEGREELVFIEEARAASKLWDRRGRRDDELWQADALVEARRKLAHRTVELPELVGAFLEASDRRLRSRARRKRALIASALALSMLVAAAAVAAALFINFQRTQAEQRRALALREGARAALGSGNVLEARAKLREALEAEDSTTARALWWRLHGDPLWWQQQLGSAIYGVSFSPDSGIVAAATQSGAVYLFDSTTGASRIFRGHRDHVFATAFSPDGRLLASASLDKTVRIWSVELGTVKRVLEGHEKGVRDVSFSATGKLIASASYDGTVRLWDADLGEQQRALEGHEKGVQAVSFSPDGSQVASGGVDGTVRLWNAETGAVRHILRGHEMQVFGVRFSPDGQRLASAGSDGTARIWSVGDGEETLVLRGHRGGVLQVSFSADGKRLATAGADQTIRLWDTERGELLATYQEHAQAWAVAFSADGRLLASGAKDGRVRLRSLGAVEALRTSQAPSGHRGPVMAVALSPDGELVASGGIDQTIRLWDARSGKQHQVLLGHSGQVTAATFSPDGKVLASGSADRTVRFWNVESGSETRVLVGHGAEVHDLAFSPNGRLLATASFDRSVRLWSARSGVVVRVLRGHTDQALGVAFGPKGRKLASGGRDQTVRLWDIGRGRARHVMTGHEGRVYGVAFSPDGDTLASASADGTIRLWDPKEGTGTVLSRQPGRVHGLQFHPDGKRLAAPGSDGIARIWHVEEKQALELRGHRSEVNAMRFSADGKLVVTAGDDGTPRLWYADTGRPYWRAPVLLGDPPRLLTHRGWTVLDGSTAVAEPSPSKWRKAVEEQARLATQSQAGSLLCVRTYADAVQLWDMAKDAKLAERDDLPVDDVIAVPTGCLARAKDEVWLLDRTGKRIELRVAGAPTALGWSNAVLASADAGAPLDPSTPAPAGKASAAATGDGRVLVVAGGEVLIYDPQGALLTRNAVAAGATAIVQTSHYFILGFPDGSIEMLPVASGVPPPTFSFERVPASAVLTLREGPSNTLIAGYGNGLLSIWDQQDGARLGHEELHGPVVHLHLEGDRLYAATDLGGHFTWDLSAFSVDRCELLQQIWKSVPVVWERGRAVTREPPADHPCR